jgi:hypothetical protein
MLQFFWVVDIIIVMIRMWIRVVWLKFADVSEEHIAFIVKVKE